MLEVEPDEPKPSAPQLPGPTSSPTRARGSRRPWLLVALATILVAIEAVLASVMAAKIRDGASVLAFEAEGGVPARLYMPFAKDDQPFDARPERERPAVLV